MYVRHELEKTVDDCVWIIGGFRGLSGRMVSDGFVADLTAEIRDRRQVAAAQTRREAEPDNKSIVMRTQRWKEILQTLIALAPVVWLHLSCLTITDVTFISSFCSYVNHTCFSHIFF